MGLWFLVIFAQIKKQLAIMPKIKIVLVTFLLLTVIFPSFAQGWTKVPNLPETSFTALEVIDGIIFTASGNTLYYSNDNGTTWLETTITSEPVMATVFKKFGNTLYVGMDGHGIYSIDFDNLSGSWAHDIDGNILVTSFVERDGLLYASTDGHGIYRCNVNNSWSLFMNELFVHNFSKLIATPESLIATGGANGVFYRYDFIGNKWVEDFYFSGISAGLRIWDAMLIGNALYVLSDKHIIRSDDNGNNWIYDQTGIVMTGKYFRIFAEGKDNLYTLSYNGRTAPIYLSKRKRNATLGSSWSNDPETLPSSYAYSLREAGDNIYIAAEDGLYVKANTDLGTEHPNPKNDHILVHPNPSANGKFTINSSTAIRERSIYDVSGKMIAIEKNPLELSDFTVPRQGIYLVKVITDNATHIFKVISKL